jgi:hypothetical protein
MVNTVNENGAVNVQLGEGFYGTTGSIELKPGVNSAAAYCPIVITGTEITSTSGPLSVDLKIARPYVTLEFNTPLRPAGGGNSRPLVTSPAG